MRLLRPNRGLMPHQADFIFGQIRTDATLQTCAYSDQIGAFRRIKRTSSLVKSGPTPRSKRALTQTKSGHFAAQEDFIFGQIRTDSTLQACTYSDQIGAFRRTRGLHLRSNQDRLHTPSVHLLRPNRGLLPHQADFIFGQIRTDATLQACTYLGQIGAFRRIKRTSSSVKSGPTPHSRRALT
jgi:hypothetical protein